MEIEFNTNQENLSFKVLENVTIGLNLGDDAVDIELLKQNVNIENDSANNVLLWHVANLHENESAVLSFASSKLVFDDMFPLDVKFTEQYSLIDIGLQSNVVDANSGEDMSNKFTCQMQSDGYKVSLD